MVDQFVGEIRSFAFGFAPPGWAACNGQFLNIRQQTQLFSILGTTYGGDGVTTFGLPNFSGGRAAMGFGQGPGLTPRPLGSAGGAPAVSLTKDNLPAHTHRMMATSSPADVSSPTSTTALARTTGKAGYGAATSLGYLNTQTVGEAAGGGRPHNNMMPFQVMAYYIALAGIYPHRP